MSSLKKFEGYLATANGSSVSGIKLEQAFLAENEEGLLAAGYIKQYLGGKGGKTGRGGYSQCSQGQATLSPNQTNNVVKDSSPTEK